jgi:putative DNA primase/helicase
MSFNDWMRGEYSREDLVGKKVVVFSDTRLKAGKFYGQNYDPGGLEHTSVELLLKISGRDVTRLPQKWKKAWEGLLDCKTFITSNDPLNVTDQILLGRLLTVDFQQSWANRDDRDEYLREKLDAELSGIANKCMAAYRRLLGRGYFIQPKSARTLVQTMAAKTHPLGAFMQECWVLDDRAEGPFAHQIRDAFEIWCGEHRRGDLIKSYPANLLLRGIREIAAYAFLHDVKAHGDVRRYPGIRRRTEEDDEEKEEALEPEKAVAGSELSKSWRRC